MDSSKKTRIYIQKKPSKRMKKSIRPAKFQRIQKRLPNVLFGTETPNNFNRKLKKCSNDDIKNLIRNQFPKFTQDICEPVTVVFISQFIGFKEIPDDTFAQLAVHPDFWTELITFHDYEYHRTMLVSEVIEYLVTRLFPFKGIITPKLVDTDKDKVDKKYILDLLNSLFSGEVNPADFHVKVSKFNSQLAMNLFRDSLPKFKTELRSLLSNIFVRYFFHEFDAEPNELWQFVNYQDFWSELKSYHNLKYSRNFKLEEVVKYFETTFSKKTNILNLSTLEKRAIEKIDKNPNILNENLANQLNISEKETSKLLANLNIKGIYVGSSTYYSPTKSSEFFVFNQFQDSYEQLIVMDKYILYPYFELYYGLCVSEVSQSNAYAVEEKKQFFNRDIFIGEISIKEAKKSTHFVDEQKIETESNFYLTDAHRSSVLELLKNIEMNYRRPNIKEIAERNDISIRTLFRIKSKLKELGIINPQIVIDSDKLTKLFLISSKEPDELYYKVPFIKSFKVKVKDESGNEHKWFSFPSIFPVDFPFFFSENKKKMEIFQIISHTSNITGSDFSAGTPGHPSAPTPIVPGTPPDDPAALDRRIKKTEE